MIKIQNSNLGRSVVPELEAMEPVVEPDAAPDQTNTRTDQTADAQQPPPPHQDEPPPPPNMMMPPNDESAFPALPMFAADAGELARATAPANMLMIATSVSDALAASAMAFGGADGVQAQSGLSY